MQLEDRRRKCARVVSSGKRASENVFWISRTAILPSRFPRTSRSLHSRLHHRTVQTGQTGRPIPRLADGNTIGAPMASPAAISQFGFWQFGSGRLRPDDLATQSHSLPEFDVFNGPSGPNRPLANGTGPLAAQTDRFPIHSASPSGRRSAVSVYPA